MRNPYENQNDYNSVIEILSAYTRSVIDNDMSNVFLVIAGGFKADLKVFLDTNNFVSLADRVNVHNLVVCTKFYTGMLSYAFRNDKRGVYSHIDNIFIPYINAKNNNIVVDIFDNIDNFSDHLAVSCMISCDFELWFRFFNT